MQRSLAFSGLFLVSGLLAYGGYQYLYLKAPIKDLAQRTRDQLIYVEGGAFEAGNYEFTYRLPDGTKEQRWSIESHFALPPYEVDLSSFYLQDRETTNADFNLYLQDTGQSQIKAQEGYPATQPDRAANLAWHEAAAYCEWLGEVTALPLRLPTEAEWEYAARSRVFSPLLATDDGEFRKGINAGNDDGGVGYLQPVANLPPTPMGFYNLADSLYEWVSDKADSDPDTVRIAKGGSDFSTIIRETIPSRNVIEGVKEPIPGTPDADRIMKNAPSLIHLGLVTVRCAADVSDPPAQSGFGIDVDETIELPDAYGPYDQTGQLQQ